MTKETGTGCDPKLHDQVLGGLVMELMTQSRECFSKGTAYNDATALGLAHEARELAALMKQPAKTQIDAVDGVINTITKDVMCDMLTKMADLFAEAEKKAVFEELKKAFE